MEILKRWMPTTFFFCTVKRKILDLSFFCIIMHRFPDLNAVVHVHSERASSSGHLSKSSEQRCGKAPSQAQARINAPH